MNLRQAAWWVTTVCLLASAAAGDMVTRRWGSPPAGAVGSKAAGRPAAGAPAVYVPEAKDAPRMDGALSDAAWSGAAVVNLARKLDGSAAAAQPTEIRLLRDGRNLYVGIRAVEPHLDRIVAVKRGHDGPVWDDDCVEMFIGVGGGYYQFTVNAAGSSYDGKAKDAAWNSGMTAAAGSGAGQWTATVSIPLAALAGSGKMPAEWTANFTRSRQVAGTPEESSWAVMPGGDSHQPDCFGRMIFSDAPAAGKSAGPAIESPARNPVEILSAQEGLATVKFDLSSIKGVTIYRADLWVYRSQNMDGTFEEAMTDVEVFPVFEAVKAGDKPGVQGRPLAIRAPWFDRLDATAAVAGWVAGRINGGFFIKSCPFLSAGNTCLDVYYEGRDKPANVPPQVTDVKAFHSAGQTMITWKEIEDVVGRDEIAWGDFKPFLETLDRVRQVRYCVFRSDKPVTAATLGRAELVAQVKPLSGWNINGRNIEKGIDKVIATRYALNHHQWNPFAGATQDDQFGRECAMERLAVRDGEKPVNRDTGVYVHTAGAAGKAYYAVLTMVDGVANTVIDRNATGAIEETKAEPRPVLQKIFPKQIYFNYPETRYHYVTFAAPPFANLPYQYYNWAVAVPEAMDGDPYTGIKSEKPRSLPIELSLPLDGHSHQRTQWRLEPDSIVISPHDFPVNTWWYGYHESLGTLKSFKQGAIQPYTERRLLAFLDWAAGKWQADRNRVVVTGRFPVGANGALHLGVMHPDVFVGCFPGAGAVPDYADIVRAADAPNRAAANSLQAIFGKLAWGCRTDGGQVVWEALDLNRILAASSPRVDMPLVTMTGSRAPGPVLEFAARMLEKGQPFIANFDEWGGPKIIPVSARGTWPPPMIRGYLARDAVMPCFGRGAADAIRNAAKPYMAPNLGYRWDSVSAVDKPDRLEIAVWCEGRGAGATDVTLRRMRNFKVEPGKKYRWKLEAPAAKPAAAAGREPANPPAVEGDAAADADGVLTLRNVRITGQPAKIVVTPG